MPRESIDQLEALLSVAREGNFTRAAAKLGISQSALSQTGKGLEAQMGVRLLTRTTRSVSLTEVGQRLFESVGPRLDDIRGELAAIRDSRDKPAGMIRITAAEDAAEMVLWPALEKCLPRYPDITVEVIVDYGLTDIVAERYDAGIRLGDTVAKDMISVPISGEQRMLVAGSLAYFERAGKPRKPQDLLAHSCINLRLPTRGGLYPWEFERGGREVNVWVSGPLVCNNLALMTNAALAGLGLAYLPVDRIQPYLDDGRLIAVLQDWSPPYPGFRLYYPSRRQHSAAFAVIAEALRYRS